MKRILRYLEWLPFAIALGALVIYLVYTIQIKMNPAIIITDKLINTLKTYLIIALVSLFIGLLIILVKKIRKLILSGKTEKVVTTTTITQTPTIKEKVVMTETKNEDVIKVVEKEPIIKRTVVEEPIVQKTIVEEKIVEKEPVIEKTIVEEPIKQTKVVEEKIVNNYTYKVNGIVCPECNNYISSNAGICPHCGILFDDKILDVINKYEKGKYKVRRNPFVTIANILLTILFIILIFLICNMLYNKYNQNLKNINYIMQRR